MRRSPRKPANAIAVRLGKMGVSGGLMTIGSLGENTNAASTKEVIKESGNRSVEMTVRY